MAGIDTRTTGATDRNEGGRHLHAQVDRSVEPLPMGRPLIHQAALHGEVGGLVDHDAIPTSSRAVGAEFSGRGPLVWTYVRCLSRRRLWILGFWVAMFVAGAIMAPRFMQNTTMNFDPPSSSPSGIADRVLARHFPQLDRAAAGVVIVRTSHGGSVLGADGKGRALAAFSAALNKTIWSFEPGKPQICVGVDGYSLLNATVGPAGAVIGKGQFISANEEAAIILIQGDAKDSKRYLSFVDWVNAGLPYAETKALHADPRLALNAAQTGLGMFTEEAVEGVQRDLEKMDMVAMPIALCVLSFVLRSWRLMLIPCICIGAAATTSFGVVMLPISYATQIISFAPSVMMSCTVAMSIDYSLFLLSRYQEEVVQHGRSLEDAVHAMLASAGHTVLVSGLTLMICWLGLCFFPVNLLSSAGLAAAMSIAAAIIVNLSLTPILMFVFPTFFYHGLLNDAKKTGILAVMCCGGQLSPVGGMQKDRIRTPLAPTTPQYLADSADSAVEPYAHLLENETERRFYRLARRILDCKYCLVFICVAATIPIIYVATRLEHSLELDQMTPRRSTATTAFDYLQDTFGAGNAFPYTLVIEPPEGDARGVMSEQFFMETSALLEKIVNGFNRPHGTALGTTWPIVKATGAMILPSLPEPSVPTNTCTTHLLERRACGGLVGNINQTFCTAAGCCFNSTPAVDIHCFHRGAPPTPPPTQGAGGAVMWGLVDAWTQCKQHSDFPGCNEVEKNFGPLLDYIFERFVSVDKQATYVNLQLSLDPFSDVGQEWLEYVRRQLPTNGLLTPRYYITHGAAEIKDSADTVYRDFPIIGVVTLGVVFVLYWAAFGSLIIPLRAIVSMCFAISWVFGLSVLIYQQGVLQWTGVSALSPTPGSPQLCWLIPVMAFSIMVGLSLDYDVFLVSRIVEYRAEGKDDVNSVLLGLAKTGRIITAAGLIMAIAFFGLLLSNQASMNELSLFLVVAVMFDTFIVAIFLIPAMMGIVGEANWWPKVMPPISNVVPPAEGALSTPVKVACSGRPHHRLN